MQPYDKKQILADSIAYWNPGKTKFWQDAGVPLVIGGILIMYFFGEKLLPHTQGPSLPGDFSRHARTL